MNTNKRLPMVGDDPVAEEDKPSTYVDAKFGLGWISIRTVAYSLLISVVAPALCLLSLPVLFGGTRFPAYTLLCALFFLFAALFYMGLKFCRRDPSLAFLTKMNLTQTVFFGVAFVLGITFSLFGVAAWAKSNVWLFFVTYILLSPLWSSAILYVFHVHVQSVPDHAQSASSGSYYYHDTVARGLGASPTYYYDANDSNLDASPTPQAVPPRWDSVSGYSGGHRCDGGPYGSGFSESGPYGFSFNDDMSGFSDIGASDFSLNDD